jgi:hypothetical protein
MIGVKISNSKVSSFDIRVFVVMILLIILLIAGFFIK